MNRNLSTILLFLVVVASCGKHLDKGKVYHSSLVGKWEYTEHYFSIGGPGKWQPVQPGGQTVDFKSDGTFNSAASFSASFQKFEIIDSTTVKFTPASTNTGYVLMRYEINEVEGILLLHPIDPICIEGCSYKFKRSQ